MTASDSNQTDRQAPYSAHHAVDVVVRHIEQTCHTVIDGRRAARVLTEWTRRFALSETEFQLLWCLRLPQGGGFDQTALASQLALSPAQVSASVERLRIQGWIAKQSAAGDRRRHLWQLTPSGAKLLEEMLAEADPIHFERPSALPSAAPNFVPREAAA